MEKWFSIIIFATEIDVFAFLVRKMRIFAVFLIADTFIRITVPSYQGSEIWHLSWTSMIFRDYMCRFSERLEVEAVEGGVKVVSLPVYTQLCFPLLHL